MGDKHLIYSPYMMYIWAIKANLIAHDAKKMELATKGMA
jgi:hypothetical protein